MSKQAKKRVIKSFAEVAKEVDTASNQAVNAHGSNLPDYSVRNAIADAMDVANKSGRAEAGMLVALFNETENNGKPTWSLDFLTAYFSAKQKAVMIIGADGKKHRDKSQKKRGEIAEEWMTKYSPEYAEAQKQLKASKVLKAKAEKDKDVMESTRLKFDIGAKEAPIKNAYQMFHRALQSLYRCRQDNVVSLKMGESNQLVISDGKEEKQYSARDIRERGYKALVEKGHITQRPRTTGTTTNGNANGVTNTKPTLEKIGELISSDAFSPVVESEKVVDQTDIAELALSCVLKLTRDATKNEGIRAAMSKIVATLAPMLQDKKASKVKRAA